MQFSRQIVCFELNNNRINVFTIQLGVNNDNHIVRESERARVNNF